MEITIILISVILILFIVIVMQHITISKKEKIIEQQNNDWFRQYLYIINLETMIKSNKNIVMEKFQKTGKRLNKTLEQLRNECVEYLNSVLKDNTEIDLCNNKGFDNVYVTYDGGKHPEYNSNAFSLIQSVSVVNSEIVFNLEDEDEVSIDRIDTIDLYNVCDLISEIYKQ